MHEGISDFSYLRCSSYLVILSGDFLCTFYSPSSRWWKQSWYRRELSCNDGCVYKTRRNQYEAKFLTIQLMTSCSISFRAFHNASFETNTESKSRTTIALRSVLTQDGYLGAVWWALTCIFARSLRPTLFYPPLWYSTLRQLSVSQSSSQSTTA